MTAIIKSIAMNLETRPRGEAAMAIIGQVEVEALDQALKNIVPERNNRTDFSPSVPSSGDQPEREILVSDQQLDLIEQDRPSRVRAPAPLV